MEHAPRARWPGSAAAARACAARAAAPPRRKPPTARPARPAAWVWPAQRTAAQQRGGAVCLMNGAELGPNHAKEGRTDEWGGMGKKEPRMGTAQWPTGSPHSARNAPGKAICRVKSCAMQYAVPQGAEPAGAALLACTPSLHPPEGRQPPAAPLPARPSPPPAAAWSNPPAAAPAPRSSAAAPAAGASGAAGAAGGWAGEREGTRLLFGPEACHIKAPLKIHSDNFPFCSCLKTKKYSLPRPC